MLRPIHSPFDKVADTSLDCADNGQRVHAFEENLRIDEPATNECVSELVIFLPPGNQLCEYEIVRFQTDCIGFPRVSPFEGH